MGQLKYTTLIDYVLVVLRIVRNHNSSAYASLVQILNIFDHKASFSEVQELGRYLEARGWAKVIFPLGDVRAQITTSGLVYVEDKGEGFFEEFSKFRSQMIKDRKEDELLIQLFLEQDNPKEKIIGLLNEVKEKIRTKEGEVDFLKDIDVIKVELSKLDPDFRLIEVKLTSLGRFSFISSEIEELKSYLIPQG